MKSSRYFTGQHFTISAFQNTISHLRPLLDPDAVPALLEGFGMTLLALPVSAAVPAAKAFAVYLDRVKRDGKRPASKVPLPDFLIGAHAQVEGWRLVTRDPDRIRTYFPQVELLTP